MKTSKFNAVVLLLSDARGVYIPRDFTDFDMSKWHINNRLCEDLQDPTDEQYWYTWESVLNSAYYVDECGNKFELYQDGDLWAICYDKMTNEEKINFGFDIEEGRQNEYSNR